ncbi:hypothetical protein LINPERHAP2_LOCUS31861 [Linum perenne]
MCSTMPSIPVHGSAPRISIVCSKFWRDAHGSMWVIRPDLEIIRLIG